MQLHERKGLGLTFLLKLHCQHAKNVSLPTIAEESTPKYIFYFVQFSKFIKFEESPSPLKLFSRKEINNHIDTDFLQKSSKTTIFPIWVSALTNTEPKIAFQWTLSGV